MSTQCANAICVTVYNEAGQLLRNTFETLVPAIDRFHQGVTQRESHSTVCVIVDGRERMHGSLSALLQETGLLCSAPMLDERGDEFHVTHRTIAAAGDVFGGRRGHADAAGAVQFIVCIKAENRGKLESHHIFFHELCPGLSPRYCWQVDTGTTLDPEAMVRLHRAFERDDRLAGLAPSVLLPTPDFSASILECWQYWDFAYRNAVGWPFEVLGGYLSVLPGQASVVRWRAMMPAETQSPRAQAPLSAYLRGLDIEGTLERLMYLAEDRVIGGELMFSDGECTRLDYENRARATTDGCNSYSELFRQRRRWSNSTLACRVWLFGRWSEWVRRADRSVSEKLHFSIALFVQGGFSLTEFLAPAQWLAFVSMFGFASLHGAPWLLPAMFACTGIELATVRAVNSRNRHVARIGGGAAALFALASSALFVFFLLRCLPASAATFLLIPALSLLPMIKTVDAKGWVRMVIARLSPVTYLLVSAMLTTYAMFRIDDITWGTRGLTRSGTVTEQAARLRRLRNCALGGFATINAAVAGLAFTSPWFMARPLNPIVEISCVLELIVAAGAVMFFALRRKTKRSETLELPPHAEEAGSHS